MGTISPAKTAGYCLILGPIIALICFFLQPGGVLGIAGSPEALDFAEGIDAPGTGKLTKNKVLKMFPKLK